MIIFLDTRSGECRVGVATDHDVSWHSWQADRQLAHGLLGYLRDTLKTHHATFEDITGIGVFRGPGSFTGLRIGLTVANTLADALTVPIVGANGDAWVENAADRLQHGENDRVVLPEYGADARITKPRK